MEYPFVICELQHPPVSVAFICIVWAHSTDSICVLTIYWFVASDFLFEINKWHTATLKSHINHLVLPFCFHLTIQELLCEGPLVPVDFYWAIICVRYVFGFWDCTALQPLYDVYGKPVLALYHQIRFYLTHIGQVFPDS